MLHSAFVRYFVLGLLIVIPSLAAAYCSVRHCSLQLFAMNGPSVQPPNRPNTCTYWVSDQLLAGEYPGRKRGDTDVRLEQYLKNAGITYFLDLTNAGEKAEYVSELEKLANKLQIPVRYKRLAIEDFGVPSKTRMMEILDTIDQAVASKDKVYVHCRGGIGRTGTVVGCYLVRHGNTPEGALREVNRLFQSSDRSMESYRSPETNDQEQFVRNWSG